jgi:Family of unknown function (DUF6494)
MKEEVLNRSMREFLKHVGVHSQREIEKAVATAIADKTIEGNESFAISMSLHSRGLNLEVNFEGEIRLE